MVETLKIKILKYFANDYLKSLEQKDKDLEWLINQRVAEAISKMDPLTPLLKQHSVIFSEEFERVEDRLDNSSRINLTMWAWGQRRDPYMGRMIEWVMNSAGNTMIKAPARTNEDRAQILMWGKAQIANMILFRNEIGQLANLYEEMLEKNKGQYFDDEKLIE